MKKKILCALSTLLVLVLILSFLQRLVTPKYVDDVVEGALIAEYYDDAPNHDVVFIGDCEVYENFSPQLLFDEYGINSYIRGSAQQLIWQSYYLLEDTLKYEKPDVVVFNVLSMKYNEPQNEAYNRMTLEGMRWSTSKVKSIRASMTEDENFIEYVFPILRYHSRISDLKKTDFTYLWDTEKVSHNGYYLRVDVKPAEGVPEGNILADYNFGDNAYRYLNMMTKLCYDEGIELVLIKAPSLYPYWYPEWETQIEEFASEHALKYINFLDPEILDETGVDFSTDTYDSGLHLNLSGAEKVTRYLGNFLRSECGLTDRRGEEPLSTFFDEKRERYLADIESQYAALEAKETAGITPVPSLTDTPVAAVASEHKGFTFVFGGTEFGVDEDSVPVVASLGEPKSYYEAVSCAFEGLDKIYTYSSFRVETYPSNGKDLISTISLKDDAVSTREGVMIGSSESTVLETYGEPAEHDGNRIVYTKDNMNLVFIIRDGSVALIEYKSVALSE